MWTWKHPYTFLSWIAQSYFWGSKIQLCYSAQTCVGVLPRSHLIPRPWCSLNDPCTHVCHNPPRPHIVSLPHYLALSLSHCLVLSRPHTEPRSLSRQLPHGVFLWTQRLALFATCNLIASRDRAAHRHWATHGNTDIRLNAQVIPTDVAPTVVACSETLIQKHVLRILCSISEKIILLIQKRWFFSREERDHDFNCEQATLGAIDKLNFHLHRVYYPTSFPFIFVDFLANCTYTNLTSILIPTRLRAVGSWPGMNMTESSHSLVCLNL